MSTQTDRIIKDLANGSRLAHRGDRPKIVQRLLEAEFSKESLSIEHWDERPGAKIVGRLNPLTGGPLTPETILGSAAAHLAKRIADGDWPEGTSVEAYLGDLRAAIRNPLSEFYVGIRGGAANVGVFCPVPLLGEGASVQGDGDLFVVYKVPPGRLSSGYVVPAGERDRVVKMWQPKQMVPKLAT